MPYVGGVALWSNVVGRGFSASRLMSPLLIGRSLFITKWLRFPSTRQSSSFSVNRACNWRRNSNCFESDPDFVEMKEKYPDFVEKLEEHGEDDDPSSPIGRGWKSTFLTKDKSVAEERAGKLGMKLEWTEEERRRSWASFQPSNTRKHMTVHQHGGCVHRLERCEE